MNTQNVIINRKNVVAGTNNTKYIYKFPQPIKLESQEIALASMSIYYSWANIQDSYKNNVFTYMWWDIQGVLKQRNDIIIPDGNYSISTLSAYIQSQMLLRGHYLKDTRSQANKFFLSLSENSTYYACQIRFTAMPAIGSSDATNYVNENQGIWNLPVTKQYPKVIFDGNYTMLIFLGYKEGTYPTNNIQVATTYDFLSNNGVPETYFVSAINVQCNMCLSNLAIPNNILYSFSQGNSSYGDIAKEPYNLIWLKIPDGFYSQLELTFIDQDFNPMKILDSQINIILLIRDV